MKFSLFRSNCSSRDQWQKTINERFVFIPLDKHPGEKIKAKVVLIFLEQRTTSLWITPLSIPNHRKGVCQLSFTRKSVP